MGLKSQLTFSLNGHQRQAVVSHLKNLTSDYLNKTGRGFYYSLNIPHMTQAF